MANIFVADGDSISAGFGTMSAYTTVLPLYNAWTINNVAVVSETLQTMLANAPTVVDPLIGAATGRNAAVIWAGTNDFFLNDTPVATVYGYLQSYCLARRAAGWKVFVVPMISRTGNTQNGAHVMDTLKTAYNALINSATTLTFCDGVVSLPTTLTANGASMNTTFFQDGIHPTQFAMQSISAPEIANTVNSFYFVTSYSSVVASDNFTRADANPIGGNWTTVTGESAMKLASNTMQPSTAGGLNAARWNANALNNDQYIEFTIGALAVSASDVMGPAGRIASAANSFYSCLVHPPAGSADANAQLGKISNGSFTTSIKATVTPNVGDVIRLELQSSMQRGYQNGVLFAHFADSAFASGSPGVSTFLAAARPTTDLQISSWDTGNILNAAVVSDILGNVGVSGVTVSWSGGPTGNSSVTSDSSGNYDTGAVMIAGNYTVTPTKSGYTFSPTSQVVSVGNTNVTGINFTAIAGVYSVPDCRVAPAGPNASRTVQGTKIYDVQTSSNHAIPPTDSRTAGALVDSRASGQAPQNSRTPGTYGPGNN